MGIMASLKSVLTEEHLPPTWRCLLISLLLGTGVILVALHSPVEGAACIMGALWLLRQPIVERATAIIG